MHFLPHYSASESDRQGQDTVAVSLLRKFSGISEINLASLFLEHQIID